MKSVERWTFFLILKKKKKKKKKIRNNTAQKAKFSITDFFSKVTKYTGSHGFGHIYWRNR